MRGGIGREGRSGENDRRRRESDRKQREENRRKRTTQWTKTPAGVRVGKKEILSGKKTSGNMSPNKSRYQGNAEAPRQSRRQTIIGGRRAAAGRPVPTERKTLLGGGEY